MKNINMIRKALVLVFALFIMVPAFSQEDSGTSWLYKGTVGNLPVSMFVREYVNECNGNSTYIGMYRYDSKSKWIILFVEQNNKVNWCLTERDFTGVLLLKRSEKMMTGFWVSPDHSKELNVKMQIQYPNKEERRQLLEHLDNTLAQYNDC